LQLLSPGLCDKLEDNDSEDYEDFGEVDILSKEGITKTLSSAYDELNDLTDQLQNALDETIKEADEYLASKRRTRRRSSLWTATFPRKKRPPPSHPLPLIFSSTFLSS